MLSTKNKARFMSVITILAMLFSFAQVSPAKAEGTPPADPPGWTQGSGIHFALPNSPYLPVTLDSSVPITLTLSSVPKVVDLTISANPAIGSAEFTLSGFAANTLYYRYADNGLDPVTFTTDATGSFTYTQDLTVSHHVWFRETPSTYYLYDDATGGDCASFGAWDWGTKTCTLTADVYQTIWIAADGITLDGNGFSSLYSDYYYAVYSSGYNDVTIKNLNVSGSTYGIYFDYGNNITVTNNTVSSYYYGIVANQNSNLTVTNNTVSTYYYGIIVNSSSNFTVTDNTITDAYYYGIYLWDANNGTIRGNTISNGSYYGGVYIDGYLYSEDYWYYGTHYVYSYDYSSTNNTVYQNNFVNVGTPIYLANWGYTYSWDYRPGSFYCVTYGYCDDYYGSRTYDTSNPGNVFNLAAPDGGNYYSQFDESAEGCNDTNSDGFCDSAFVGSGGAVDYLPWTTQIDANTPPTANANGPYLVAVGQQVTLDGTGSSDPDLDLLTETWTADGGTVSGNVFTAGSVPGIYDVCLTVNDGTVDSDPNCTMVVVYDPSAGFVTGGGWINSPAGAYTADPSLSGKANFGFVAKYKKGANVPDGNTQFQFKAGDLNFHSSSYQWLVVAGKKAQFKGEGTINGSGHYGFMLTAIDGQISGGGGVDKFRIKIWDMDNGDALVYDNQMSGADTADPTTVLGGGSIVIHK